MKRLLLALLLFTTPALAQNPGVTTQGAVTAGDCVKFVNRNLIASNGAACFGGASSFGNPTNPGVNLTGSNGTALTAMRSDAVLILDQAIAPTWTGLHAWALGTITTSQPYTFTQTWNASGVTFTGLLYNVTHTAAAVASKIFDFQRSGTSLFQLKTGGTGATSIEFSSFNNATGAVFRVGNSNGAAQYNVDGGGNTQIRNESAARAIIFEQNAEVARFVATTGDFSLGASSNLFLGNAGAATLRQGAADAAAPVAQNTRVQSVVAGTTNTAGVNWTFRGSLSTGNGVSGDVIWTTGGTGAGATAQNSAVEVVRFTGATNNVKFRTSSTGAGVQTFTNSPCGTLTTAQWIPVEITGQSGTWHVPACQ